MASLFARHWPQLAVISVAFAYLGCAPVRVSAQSGAAVSAMQRVPVLVELFTSEGCSDCPPADALLAQLDAKQPVANAEAIVLSEHVTYWDHLGWRDPFSLDAATERQAEYVRQFGLDSSYTPQMVVDGSTQFVGGNGGALLAAVTRAAAHPKQALSIEGARWTSADAAEFSVHGVAESGTRIIAVLAENATHSEVARGENAGRALHHVAVVRVFKEFPAASLDGRRLRVAGYKPLGAQGEVDSPRLVVFVVDHRTGHVIAAAEQQLPR